ADGRTEAADARRAVARAGAGDRPADLRFRARPRPAGEPVRAAAGAERRPGTAPPRPGVRDARRPHHPRGDRRGDARQTVVLGPVLTLGSAGAGGWGAVGRPPRGAL